MINLDLKNVQFSKNDLARGIVLPKKLDEDLAYLSGFLAGDGTFYAKPNKYGYFIGCYGNLKDEKQFYDEVIVPFFRKLFNITVIPKSLDQETTYEIKIKSKAIWHFFTKIIEFPSGKKCDKIKIPNIFKQSDNLIKSFIQGFADADFCFTLKRRYKKEFYYPCIEGESASKEMINDIAFYLYKFGFKFTKCKVVRFDKRVNKFEITYRIDLNGYLQLFMWMMIIGFRNFKYIRKFEEWRKNNSSNKKISKALKTLVKINSGAWNIRVRPF